MPISEIGSLVQLDVYVRAVYVCLLLDMLHVTRSFFFQIFIGAEYKEIIVGSKTTAFTALLLKWCCDARVFRTWLRAFR